MPATRYPLNQVCAHPECDSKDITAHHIFGRPPGEHSDSWFVELPAQIADPTGEWEEDRTAIIPHVIGLCGHGTVGHHGDVEAHRAWIKYEDGEFVWYDRRPMVSYELHGSPDPTQNDPERLVKTGSFDEWDLIGLLDPQPGQTEKRKRRRRKLKGVERRNKPNLTLKVPKDEQEDGAGLFYDAIEQLEEALGYDPHRSAYYTVMDALNLAILHGLSDD